MRSWGMGMNSQSTKDFQSSETNAIIWTHVIIHLSKLIECMKQKSDCIIRVIMMCQCGLTSCNKCTILWGMLIIGEVVQVQGHGVCGKSLVLHLDFALKLKLFFKECLKNLIEHIYSFLSIQSHKIQIRVLISYTDF